VRKDNNGKDHHFVRISPHDHFSQFKSPPFAQTVKQYFEKDIPRMFREKFSKINKKFKRGFCASKLQC